MSVTVNGIVVPGVADLTFTRSVGLQSDTIRVPILRRDLSRLTTQKAIGMPGGAKVITLVAGGRTIRDLRLTVIENTAPGTGEEPFLWLVLVDRRHYWSRKLFTLAYNIKRKQGLRTATDTIERSPRVEAAIETLDIFEYRAGTLINESLVTVRDAFTDIITRLGETPGKTFIIPKEFGKQILAPMETVGPGNYVLNRVLEQATEYSVALDDDAVLTLIERVNTAATQAIMTAVPGSIRPKGNLQIHTYERGTNRIPDAINIVDGVSTVRVLDLQYERPSEIEVFFDLEQELPFVHSEDFDENLSENSRYNTFEEYKGLGYPWTDVDIPVLEAVVRNPIRDLRIRGYKAEDSWLRMKQFFVELRHQIPRPVSNSIGWPTFSILRKLWLRKSELHANFFVSENKPDDLWASIISAIMRSFRTTFKVNRPWWDRIRAIRPFRSALVNPFDFTRAFSPVYTNYTIWPSWRLILMTTKETYNKHGFVVRGYGGFPDSYKPSGGRMRIIDPDAGIVEMKLRKSTHGEERKIIPGTVLELQDGADYGNIDGMLQAGLELESEWGFLTIMSCMPYYRQDNSFMFSLTVKPKVAAQRLGVKIGPCKGPKLQIKIPYTEVTAARFFLDLNNPGAAIDPFLDNKVAFDRNRLANLSTIEDIAIAAAAQQYSTMLDHVSGSVVHLGLDPEVPFVGSMKSQTINVSGTDGMITRTITALPELPIISFSALLDPQTQAELMRLKVV